MAKKTQLPAVSAYLIAGVLIGPFVLGALGIPGIGVTENQIEGFGIISDLALGIIAFLMGNKFQLAQLKKIGKQATIIGVFQTYRRKIIEKQEAIGFLFLALAGEGGLAYNGGNIRKAGIRYAHHRMSG